MPIPLLIPLDNTGSRDHLITPKEVNIWMTHTILIKTLSVLAKQLPLSMLITNIWFPMALRRNWSSQLTSNHRISKDLKTWRTLISITPWAWNSRTWVSDSANIWLWSFYQWLRLSYFDSAQVILIRKPGKGPSSPKTGRVIKIKNKTFFFEVPLKNSKEFLSGMPMNSIQEYRRIS